MSCSSCRSEPACGWCDDGNGGGRGTCLAGGARRPHQPHLCVPHRFDVFRVYCLKKIYDFEIYQTGWREDDRCMVESDRSRWLDGKSLGEAYAIIIINSFICL